MEEKPEVIQLEVPPEVKKRMAEFFMKTAIPRMIAEQEKQVKEWSKQKQQVIKA